MPVQMELKRIIINEVHDQQVIMLREVDGLNTAETAQQLCVSEGTVMTRLHRARDLLQR